MVIIIVVIVAVVNAGVVDIGVVKSNESVARVKVMAEGSGVVTACVRRVECVNEEGGFISP